MCQLFLLLSRCLAFFLNFRSRYCPTHDFFLFSSLKAKCCAPFTHFSDPFPLFILFGNYLPTDFKSRLFKYINFKINGFQIKQIEWLYNICIVILVLQIEVLGGILVNFRFYGNFGHFLSFKVTWSFFLS